MIFRPASLLESIKTAYADIVFVEDDDFYWSADTLTLHHAPLLTPADAWHLLHELGHAELEHTDYAFDIELLQQEVAAWEQARLIAPRFNLVIEQEFIDEQLDSYRDWLFERSQCPRCQQAGLQTDRQRYECLNCRTIWHTNDARRRRLKRTVVTTV